MIYAKLVERFINPRCDEVTSYRMTAKMKNYSLGNVNVRYKAYETKIAEVCEKQI